MKGENRMMMMKEDERKVLKKIRELMGSLGSDSYVATAFEGCADIAESNIDNDFMCSMKQRAESAEEESRKAFLLISDQQKEINKLKADLETANNELERLCNVNSELQRDTTGTEKALSDLRKFSKNAEAQLKEKDAEIIRLKARLFDYMTKDQQ